MTSSITYGILTLTKEDGTSIILFDVQNVCTNTRLSLNKSCGELLSLVYMQNLHPGANLLPGAKLHPGVNLNPI